MADVLTRFNSGKIWDFKGGIHPPEMKSQSNQSPIQQSELAHDFYVPIKQHAGTAGNVLVKEGDYVLKGQPLTQGDGLRTLPVHAPTSGTVKFIGKHVAPHPSGLTEDMIHIQADGLDKWREQFPLEEFFTQPVEQLIDRIYQAGVAGLGGAVFPTAAKIQSAEKKVKLLIINGAECEPYITCDDRLMRDYTDEMIEGIRILRYILRPEKVVIAVEDNKPEAIQAIQQSLHGANDIELRVIPTKYPSGAAKQLIYLLTGMEVPSGGRSYDIGVLMHNVGTAFAVKRAVINDEPLIERVVTLTGDKISEKGNYWVRLGTPVDHILAQVGYQYDERFPVFAGGPMMGLQLSDLNAPVTKLINCLLAPDHFEYGEPEPEQSCIRCSACSDACPVNLMPQQLYWYARSEDHQKSEEYCLKDCIECGVCAYVCPSHIPLIQYFRQEKAKIWEIKEKAKKAEEAKIRFEAKQARMEREEQERKARSQRAAEARREELAKQKGEDPVKAALERLKAKQANSSVTKETKTIVSEKGEILPDNHDLMEQRKARRLAKQQAQVDTGTVTDTTPSQTDEKEAKKAAVAAALARVKAKKAAQGETVATNATESAVEKTDENPTALDPKKAAVAVAIARAKAKKAAAQGETVATNTTGSAVEKTDENSTALDPKKAAVAAAIARAKAKKASAQGEAVTTNTTESAVEKTDENPTALDSKKAAVAAAIARAKAKKAATQDEMVATNATESAIEKTDENPTSLDPKKAAVAAAIARAKAKKASAQGEAVTTNTTESAVEKTDENPTALDPKKAAVAAAIARAKAKKAVAEAAKETE